MKKLFLIFGLLFIGIGCFAQESQTPTQSFLKNIDWPGVLNFVFAVSTVMVSGLFAKVKIKLRQAATLLTKFADAVDDNKVDANEKTELSQAARDLLGKK